MYVERIGLDPEVSVVSTKTGLARSAHHFINEVQQFTFRREKEPDSKGLKGSEIDRDGPAIEVRSIAPTACRDNIIPYVAEALRQAQLMVEAKGNFTLSSSPKYELDKESFEGEVPDDIAEFGCRPDFDAYSLDIKDPICEEGDVRRWTGGHIHASPLYGSAVESIADVAVWAVLFDYFVSVPIVAILGEKYAAGEAERRTKYGQPGSFRYDESLDKIEFRTLSGRVLLHPTILFWALGALKVFSAEYGGSRDLLKKLSATIPTQVVFDTVLNHDVPTAEALTMEVFKLHPLYKENEADLGNRILGGGSGTMNPYFYEQAARVFIEANHHDITFVDDMKWNWGLYENYEPRHHSYWGIQAAMGGQLDDMIFPQNEIVRAIMPAERLAKKPVYTHPTVGGAMEYTTPGAIGWLT